MDNQASYFGILPAEVRYNKDITDFAKILYAEFMALSNTYGYCFATNKYFAELYNKDADTISKTVTQLRRFGFIKVELIDSFQRKIYPLVGIGVSQKHVGGYTKTSRGIDENVYNNNKYNNKDNIYTTTSKAVVEKTPRRRVTEKLKGKTYIEKMTAPYWKIPENFNWKELLKSYSEDKNYVLNILAFFCETKKIQCDNWGEVVETLGRHTSDAISCSKFSVEKVKKAMSKAYRDLPEDFTMRDVYYNLTK